MCHQARSERRFMRRITIRYRVMKHRMSKKSQTSFTRIESIEPLILMSASAMEIEGTESGEWVQGTSGDDIINAGGGDDEIYSPEGNNTIDGGAGMDSFIIYEGVRDDYKLSSQADGSLVIEGPGLGGVTVRNTLTNVEKVVFNDGWILVDSITPDDGDDDGPDDHDDDEPSDKSGSNKSGKDDSGKSGSNKSDKDDSGKSGSNKSGKDDSGKSGSNKSDNDDSGKSGSNKSGKDDSGKSGSNKSGKDNSGKSGSNKSDKSGSGKPGSPVDGDLTAVKDLAFTTTGDAVWGNVLDNDLGLSGDESV